MNSVLRPPWFVPFDVGRAMRIYERNLPHWRQDGCTYFVTFRLADSIPDSVRREWEQDRKRWLERHGIAYDGEPGRWREALRRLPPIEQFRFEKYFNRKVQSCLDRGLGECHLRKPAPASVLRDQLLRDDGRHHHLGDFVIIHSHVHLIISPVAYAVERDTLRSMKLELILKSIKGASALACNRLLVRTGTFWQPDSYDHIVRSLEQLFAYREYIVRNPEMARIQIPEQALYRAEWMDAWLRAWQ